ncbi:YqgE/AlgH family protein [Marinobacter sp. NFXS9]|uniref:YqgE/AlgH family protein n=1 Tax=Marinobacter sp. NFXS9 TaxID=2818433 RepID=UPI0032DFCA68
MTIADDSLRNRLLVASPYLEDPGFHGTVIFMCEHNSDGAMGLVINRPLDISVGEVLEQLDLDGEEVNQPVYAGGPVQPERGFVLHRPFGEWQSSMAITDQLTMTTSRDILEAIGCGEGPSEFLMALGYSGWSPGQLEEELNTSSWLVCPAHHDLLFRVESEQRYAEVIRAMGIDLNQLTDTVGHA